MLEGARINPLLSGYCVHALCGGDWVLGAGLIDIWRNPKGAVYTETAKANQERILVMRANPRNLYSGEQINLETFIVNELDNFSGNLIISLESVDGTKFWTKNENIKVNHGINMSDKIDIPSDELFGKYMFVAGIRPISSSIKNMSS